ncbi:MAG: sialate O-acetylesterase [Verrucomicrobia bacterium]|nr:sialate O-acetylesterase [Verrucomicrobiota bacterium]
MHHQDPGAAARPRLSRVHHCPARQLPVLALALALAVSLDAASPTTADAAISVGAARAEISPSTQILNWVGHDPYPGVLDPVFARALVISDGESRAVVVTWDLTDTREGFVARVRKEIQKATGIPGDHVLINASHTHSAPWVPSEGDPLLSAEQKTLLRVEKGPGFLDWGNLVVAQTIRAVREADAAKRAVHLSIARAWAGDLVFNRRPVREDSRVETTFTPDRPYALPQAQRFGPMDPTLTILGWESEAEPPRAVATLFSLPCHPVSIYPHDKRVSADWPGPVSARLAASLGGESLFAQGCAGDIVPIRRNLPARDRMSELIGDRALEAWSVRGRVQTGKLRVARVPVTLPLNEAGRRDMGRDAIASETQAISLGDLAIVALPGEPLTALNLEIQRRSPFPHTLVLGYSNGGGVQYVGPTGEKRRGGYEMGVAGSGEDRCGQILVDAAVGALQRLRAEDLLDATTPDRLDLYLLIGQSNMAGRGPLEAIDETPHPRLLSFEANKRWRVAVDPLHHDKANAGVGLGGWFGRSIADGGSNRVVGLIPAAVGGTPLSRWVRGGDLYLQALDQARAAMKQGRLKAILWHQGENDSGAEQDAQSYARRLAGMIQDLRQDLGAGEIPFIAGELGRFLVSDPRDDTPLAKTINDQLRSLEGRVPRYAVVSSERLTVLPDRIHFDSASLREFGQRYAEALRAMKP